MSNKIKKKLRGKCIFVLKNAVSDIMILIVHFYMI